MRDFAAVCLVPGTRIFLIGPFDLGLKGRTLSMTKKLFLVLVLLLAATAAFAATSDSNSSSATATPAIRTYLMPDLSFKSVFPDLLPQSEALAPRDTLAGGPKRTGFCRCSCGFQCTSSADCGGSSCDPFITCCARTGQSTDAEWFRSSQASHKTAVPEVILKADCK